MKGKIGRAIRVWACKRILRDLRRDMTSYRSEWQSDSPYSQRWAEYYRGRREGVQHAIDLIETEYR